MANVKLSNYILKIDECYKLARTNYENILNKISENDTKYRDVDRSIYTPNGLKKIDAEYYENKKILQKELANVTDTFIRDANKVINASNELFDKKYSFVPANIDANGLAILNNANLSEKEVMQLCDDYLKNDNTTMFYMCAEKLKNADDISARTYYNNAHYMRENRPDAVVINAMMELCKKGLRTDATLANGMNKKHDSFVNAILSDAENIQVAVTDVWSE